MFNAGTLYFFCFGAYAPRTMLRSFDFEPRFFFFKSPIFINSNMYEGSIEYSIAPKFEKAMKAYKYLAKLSFNWQRTTQFGAMAHISDAEWTGSRWRRPASVPKHEDYTYVSGVGPPNWFWVVVVQAEWQRANAAKKNQWAEAHTHSHTQTANIRN